MWHDFSAGKCIGPVFPNFDYYTEAGAQAAFVSWRAEPHIDDFHVYYNGGGHFVPYIPHTAGDGPHNVSSEDLIEDNELPSLMATMSLRMNPQSWSVLSRYLQVPGHPIAVVKTNPGRGKAVLTGIHPEFIPDLLNQEDPYLQDKLPLLKASDAKRRSSVVAILKLLDIQTVARDNEIRHSPSITGFMSDEVNLTLKSSI